jgi:OOP family OmpA-OmpF porin
MTIKKLFTMSAIGLAMGVISASAMADGDGFVEDYVTNPYGEVWKNSFGECWRDRFAATNEMLPECGYEKPMAPEVVKADPPAPAQCPELIVLGKLHFGFDSASVHPDDKAMLEEARDFIRAEVPAGCYKTDSVLITGHTDSVGPEAYNEKLSLQRADAVADYLRSIGVQANLVTEGKGESEPVSDNSTKEGRAENRRVVIDINTSNN